MYEKSSFKYRTVINDVSDNKIRFLWTYRHFETPYVCIKNGAKTQIVVLEMLPYHGNKARNILILFHFFFFLIKETLVFSYKKFRKILNVKSISSTYL